MISQVDTRILIQHTANESFKNAAKHIYRSHYYYIYLLMTKIIAVLNV